MRVVTTASAQRAGWSPLAFTIRSASTVGRRTAHAGTRRPGWTIALVTLA